MSAIDLLRKHDEGSALSAPRSPLSSTHAHSVNPDLDLSAMIRTLESLKLQLIATKKQISNDPYTFNFLQNRLERYIRNEQEIDTANTILGPTKQLRHANFDSDISENIAKFAIQSYYGFQPTWQTTVGDLQYTSADAAMPCKIQFEVKGFMSHGPSSFGPKEAWDCILFVDCMRYREKWFKVYCVPLENTSEEWRAINMRLDATNIDYSQVPDIPAEPDALPVTALRELCRKRGVKHTGSKEDLLQQLKQPVGSNIRKIKTFGEIADENKRGELRAPFYTGILPRLTGEQCFVIFEGQLDGLRPL